MISRRRKPAPRVHLPLRSLALCPDCDECFEVGPETCPACGSATWTSISRFLEQASSSRRPRHPVGGPSAAKRDAGAPEAVQQLIVVARNRRDLFEHLKRAFAGNETIRVLLNRRFVDRRGGDRAPEGGQGRGARRLPPPTHRAPPAPGRGLRSPGGDPRPLPPC